MSGFGISNISALSLPSSVAGGQQARPGKDAARSDAARQDFHSTLEALSTKTSEDVDDPDLHADRDADGRNLPGFEEETSEEASAEDRQGDKSSQSSARRTSDVDGMVGRFLDLDA